jgi:hypothetical protein
MARNRRNKTRNRKMRGGSYTSASTYGNYVNGSPESQYNRVFDQGGPYGQNQGNVIIGAQGQNGTPSSRMPTSSEMALIQNGGRRHKKGGFLGEVINQALVPVSLLGMQQNYRRKMGSKKGGFLGEVVNQALVPVSLLGMQQTYRRKKGGKRNTYKRRN